jgi:hypothetical protein
MWRSVNGDEIVMNAYLYWQQEIACPGCNGRDTNRRDLAGFYRGSGAATKTDWPVAIWAPAGQEKIAVKVGRVAELYAEGSEKFEDFLGGLWPKCAAVAEADYRSAIETGRWPDGKPARKMDEAEQHGIAHARVQAHEEPAKPDAPITMVHEDIQAGIGHNRPPADNPAEALRIELDSELERAKALLSKPIDTEDAAGEAAAWRKKLNAIAKLAGQNKDVEAAPHKTRIAEIEAVWRPIYDAAKTNADALRDHLKPWLNKLARVEEDRQIAARAEAEKARIESVKMRRQAEEARNQAGVDAREAEEAEREAKAMEDAAKAADRDARAKPVQAGRVGAKVSMRDFTFARITDYPKALATFKDHPKVKEAVQTVCDDCARKGTLLPGFEIITEKRPV